MLVQRLRRWPNIDPAWGWLLSLMGFAVTVGVQMWAAKEISPGSTAPQPQGVVATFMRSVLRRIKEMYKWNAPALALVLLGPYIHQI